MKNKIFEKFLQVVNIKPVPQQWILLITTCFCGLVGTYTASPVMKAMMSDLPAEWISAQCMISCACGLIISSLWKKSIRKNVIRWFAIFATIESIATCALYIYLAVTGWNAYTVMIASIVYGNLVSKFVGKAIMAFEAKLWQDKTREDYENNYSIIKGSTAMLGFAISLPAMPSIQVCLWLIGFSCIFDDAGWIIVYLKNRRKLLRAALEED